jgi:hypothetical protein
LNCPCGLPRDLRRGFEIISIVAPRRQLIEKAE